VAEHFDWCHTVDRLKIATRLNEQRPAHPPLKVLIQINISDEQSKSGIPLEALDGWRRRSLSYLIWNCAA
jgi:uncharacterized pyridoxal phosphate-containing UPF0001 family protein